MSLRRGAYCALVLILIISQWDGGAKRGHFLDDISAPIELGDPLVPSGVKQECRVNTELFPGVVERATAERFHWLPDRCLLHQFSSDEVKQCFAKKRVTTIGDSLMRELAVNGIGLLHELPKNASMQRYEFNAHHSPRFYEGLDFFWAPALHANPPHKLAVYRDHELTKASINQADYVLLNSGMWDMGIYHCGVESFYHKLHSWLGSVKSQLKPGAQFAVMPPHWLNTEKNVKCAKTSPCFLCNHPKKIAVFREALALAASCQQVPLLDMVEVPRSTPQDARDGIHYNEPVRHMFIDVALSYVCRSLAPTPPAKCGTLQVYLDKWAAIPEVHVPCQTALGQPPIKLHAQCNQHLNKAGNA